MTTWSWRSNSPKQAVPGAIGSRIGDRPVVNATPEMSVIRVFDLPAIAWTLTAVLLFSGGNYILQLIKSHQITDRVNNGLHALMNLLMAAMIWNLVPSTMLAQIAVLTGAALWFVLQAVARPELKTLCASSQGRLQCLYHSLTMVGAALMVAMMLGHAAPTAGQGILAASEMSMPNAHHAMPVAPQGTAAATPDLAFLLTVFFGAAALVFVVLVLRFRVRRSAAAAPRLAVRAEHGFEALGAAVMATMFATMA